MKNTRKEIPLPSRLMALVLSATLLAATACSDEKTSADYNPSLPVKINELYPETGGYFDKVILRGENFGNDPKKVRVFFNKKEAIVVGVSGDRALVHVPKLPGEDCKIGVLMDGNTTDTVFAKPHFAYEKNFQLQYVTGQLNSNTPWFDEGDLQTTVFGNSMQYMACDPQGIIYVNNKGNGDGSCQGNLVYVNVPENYSKFLTCDVAAAAGGAPQAPFYDAETEKVYYCAHHSPFFWEVDPNDSWSFVKRSINAPNEAYQAKGYRPLTGGNKLEYMYSFVRGNDGFFYSRSYSGILFRFKPTDRVYDVVTEQCPKGAADSYICSDPDDPSKIYCSLLQRHMITCIDTSKDPADPDFETIVCGIQGSGGYQDGHVGLAKLNQPQQILVMHDAETGEKVMYICDGGNHCVRQYNMDTKMMSTVAGIGGQSGYATGSPAVSKMNKPVGICATPDNDIYILDAGNKVIMKLAFE